MEICKDFREFEKKHHSLIDDVDMILLGDTFFAKDIYMPENRYYNDMSIDPELKKYIDRTIEKKIKQIKKGIILTTEESLVKLWDNEYDEQWNDY